MDIELLRTFLEVNKTRHFGKASDNLYLTQAAVSARIKQLEDVLGVDLFIRARNNIQLTAEGERLLPHAETMLVAWTRARQDVALKPEKRHQLSLATTAGLWQFILQDKLDGLQRQFSELALRADAHSADELLRLLQEGALDLGLLFEPTTLPGLITQALGKLKLVLVSTEPGISLKAALQTHYVYVDWGTAFGMFHAQRFMDAPPPTLHTNMASIAQAFLLEHGGSAYLPESSLHRTFTPGEHNAKHRLYPVEGSSSFSRDIYAIYPKSLSRLSVLPALLDHLTLT
ncbi:LysR family transcriptional regulator [Aestuariicella hydrocarbonica]|uniref:LysR family transcriptional regulator n=1 Tax=Pseudomaricurvus hydrocarbonicus TaxID=1470433 RepID=A0A9E5MJB4_9GAMM|nr:LysR family transcriptional regulator [Aestuariicella hydrocarbonica]NHO64839.1 LysR family transcriptional regulator [Aestuariicella hydrocarbonica]